MHIIQFIYIIFRLILKSLNLICRHKNMNLKSKIANKIAKSIGLNCHVPIKQILKLVWHLKQFYMKSEEKPTFTNGTFINVTYTNSFR